MPPPSTGVIFTALLLTLGLFGPLCYGDASPEPDADPEPVADPEPQADPDADPDAGLVESMNPQAQQYYNPYYPRPNPGIGGIGQSPSPCELTNRCCGLANSKCCVGGQRCYTVWRRECETEDNPECRVRLSQKCFPQSVKDCRVVPEFKEFAFQAEYCVPRPLTKCFTYMKKACVPAAKTERKEIVWINEMLQVSSGERRQHCMDVQTVNCEDVSAPRNVSQQVRRTRIVPDSQRQCRMVPSTSPGQEIEVPITQNVYRQVCYDVTVPTCSTNQCQTGLCGAGQSVCSQTEFNTQTYCPLTGQGGAGLARPLGGAAVQGATGGAQVVGGGARIGVVGGAAFSSPCQQVREPVCFGGGTACNAVSQQCCSQRTQRVCRQVPQRIVRKVKQFLAGRTSWKRECVDVGINRTEYYYETVWRTVEGTRKECQTLTKNECHNVTIPSYEVVRDAARDIVAVQLPRCQHRLIKDQYCHTFPTGNLECRNQTVTKRFRINKIVCDRVSERPFCIKIPQSVCRMGSRSSCKMVPKQVCQNSCSNSATCNTCSNFIQQGPGFGSCPTSTCGNYYPGTNEGGFIGNVTGDWESGVIVVPGGSGGFFPGGGVTGGDGGFFPGGTGGEGFYPGTDGTIVEGGGEGGYYPGGDLFPGTGGSGGFYPGGETGAGGAGWYPGPGGQGGYFPGSGPNPGEEIYPGDGTGGQGMFVPGGTYPDGTGGQGMFVPGATGGDGMYNPEGTGAQGMYPGYSVGYGAESPESQDVAAAASDNPDQMDALTEDEEKMDN